MEQRSKRSLRTATGLSDCKERRKRLTVRELRNSRPRRTCNGRRGTAQLKLFHNLLLKFEDFLEWCIHFFGNDFWSHIIKKKDGNYIPSISIIFFNAFRFYFGLLHYFPIPAFICTNTTDNIVLFKLF